MNLSKTLAGLMTNKYFLYFIVFLSASNIIGYLTMNNNDAVIFFALIGFIMFNFSKNMTIVLLVAIISTNLLMVSKPFFSLEGFQEGAQSKGGAAAEKRANMDATASSAFTTKADSDKEEEKKGKTGHSDEQFTPLNPAPVKKSSHIDYATTLEDAYSNLEKMLGNDGLNNLTNDTKKLMAQQTQLFKSMENITPLIAEAQKMMKGMDVDTLNKFANSAKSFNKTSA